MKKQSLAKQKKKLQVIFNTYIRQRDEGRPCISCNQYKVLQAGHYFAVSGYDGLRFDEDNVHGECAGCNCFDESHLIGYGQRLEVKLKGGYPDLLLRAEAYKRDGYRWTRIEIEEKIEYYKGLLK